MSRYIITPPLVPNGNINTSSMVKLDTSNPKYCLQAGVNDAPVGICQPGTRDPGGLVGASAFAATSVADMLEVYAMGSYVELFAGTGGWTNGKYLKPDANGYGVVANPGDLVGALGLSTVAAGARDYVIQLPPGMVCPATGGGLKTVQLSLAAVDTAGGAFNWQNPEPVSIVVTRVLVDVQTVATGAGTLSVGTTPTSAATSSANLIDTLDVHSAVGVFDNLINPGAGGKPAQELATGKWVTGSKASGALAGLVGKVLIQYFVLS